MTVTARTKPKNFKMTQTSQDKYPIHVGKISTNQKLFLRSINDKYIWHESDIATDIAGNSIEEAIFHANRTWTGFMPLKCGFLYTLPERDEHGINALFYEMCLSYSAPDGRFFDPRRGCFCKVDFASDEALKLYRELRDEK